MISQNILCINLLTWQHLLLPLSMNLWLNECLWWWRSISLMEELLLTKVVVIFVLKVFVVWNSRALAALLFENSVNGTEFDVFVSRILFLDTKLLRINCLIYKSRFRVINLLFYSSVANMWICKPTNTLILLRYTRVICIIQILFWVRVTFTLFINIISLNQNVIILLLYFIQRNDWDDPWVIVILIVQLACFFKRVLLFVC